MGLWDAFLYLFRWIVGIVMGLYLRWFKQEIKVSQEIEVTLVGLQSSGKTSFVNVIQTGGYNEDVVSTVGFAKRIVIKESLAIKFWDMGGQPRFRSMWERYSRSNAAILYFVDAADPEELSISKSELDHLLSKTTLRGIPLLVIGNKIDKLGALSKESITKEMGLDLITNREVSCFMISCKNSTSIDHVMDWLVKHAKQARKIT